MVYFLFYKYFAALPLAFHSKSSGCRTRYFAALPLFH
jgi:hypothetical protein